ncbi:MAG: hypothetical protein HKN73_14695 [Gemmatimonadetes bacterium]|nr:hypothetical protein [Gemmatimonadota bacterium]
MDAEKRGRTRLRAKGVSHIEWGPETIDVSRLPALLLSAQTRALMLALLRVRDLCAETPGPLSQVLSTLTEELDRLGPGSVDPRGERVLAQVRVQEVAAALSRLRSLGTIEWTEPVLMD